MLHCHFGRLATAICRVVLALSLLAFTSLTTYASVTDVTSFTSVTVRAGDTLDVYFHASEFMNSFPSSWNPSLPFAVNVFGLTSFAAGQPLSAFAFDGWVQTPGASISIPFPNNPLPVTPGTINSGQTYPINILGNASPAVLIPSALQPALFGADGSAETVIHLVYVGTAPFTFEGNGVPPLQGTEMGHGVNGGLLTAYVEINLTINGQPATSGSVGNVDQVLLTTVPEPSSIILATVGFLPFALRRRLSVITTNKAKSRKRCILEG